MEIIARTDFTGIILAPGWENSKGCRMEWDAFVAAGKPIQFYDDIVAAENPPAPCPTSGG